MNVIRMLCGVAVIGIATSAATAQQDPIAARKALMKENGDQAKIGAAMAKGETPFDLVKGSQDLRDVSGHGGQGARFVSRESDRPGDGG
jgi:cytochrome c556